MSAKLDTAAESMIRNLEQKTDKSFDTWLTLARKSGISKHKALINYLKENHALSYGYANLVAHNALATERQSGDLITQQYKGKEALRPIYDELLARIESFGNDIEVSPKKTYVSLRRSKQFALIQPSTKSRVDVGINLQDVATTERLEASGSFNSMVSHRVRVTDSADIDAELLGWLEQAYEAAR